jgi:hypothetical protein
MPRLGRCADLVPFAAAAALLAPARDARACGGCFHPPTESTVVTDHRMAFSISTTQTVLWDQIKYTGSPREFAWVLPVRPGTQVQASHDEWFVALDATTQPSITGPAVNCNSGGGVGCGGSGGLDSKGSGGPAVQIVSEGVVGPYDTVTVRSTDPGALDAWLTANGFVIPPAIAPTIAAYATTGFDFIALRLRPDQGVQAMQPVRVVTAGADPSLPLRMVAAGVGANVGVTLYVIGEGRYEAQNFPNAVVDDGQLVWVHDQNRSNYQELSQQLMQAGGGTWLTEYARATSLQPSSPPSCGGVFRNSGGVTVYGGTSLADVYLCSCTAGRNCTGLDDLDAALVGLHPSDTWVTRMRAVLPAGALASDLVLQASASQTEVSNQHSTNEYDDPTYSPCGTSGGCSTSAAAARPWERVVSAGALVFAALALLRRRVVR